MLRSLYRMLRLWESPAQVSSLNICVTTFRACASGASRCGSHRLIAVDNRLTCVDLGTNAQVWDSWAWTRRHACTGGIIWRARGQYIKLAVGTTAAEGTVSSSLKEFAADSLIVIVTTVGAVKIECRRDQAWLALPVQSP